MAARKATPSEVFEIEISLLESDPRIWRRFAVPTNVSLEQLHFVVQCVMGWTNSHLHAFLTIDGIRYESRDFGFAAPEARDEKRARLGDVAGHPGTQLRYEYDFGDGWDHQLDILEAGPPAEGVTYPICLAGERACPPEDCGGLYGYYEMLEAVADSESEDHDEMVEWLGDEFDPEAFDVERVNELLSLPRRRGG